MLNPGLKDLKFPHLKEYGKFLLDHCLEAAAAENLKISREVKLPLLEVFAHLSEYQLLKISKEVLQQFFRQLVEGEALKKSIESIQHWKAGSHPLVATENIKMADISLLHHTRKQLLLDFLPQYTNDSAKVISIAKELEKFFSLLEHYSFQAFLDLRKEEQHAFTHELQETNEKLKEQITIRKQTEETLENERNYLKAVLENITDGIVACDENGILSYFNKATREFHGITEKALPAEKWSSHYQLFQPDGKTLLKKDEVPLYRAFKGEFVNEVEMLIAPENGKKRLVLSKGQPIVSSQGKKLGAVVVMHEITQLKQLQHQQKEIISELNKKNQGLAEALRKLKETEEQLAKTNNELEVRVEARTNELRNNELQMRLITDALPVLISFVDAEEKYRFINKAYEDWFELPRQEIYGKRLEEIIGSESYKRVKPTVDRALSGETLYLETQLDYIGVGKKHVSVHYIPHKINNSVVGYFALITDISDHKNAEERLKRTEADLRKRNEELERINNDLDNFIYTASHDLKSPVVNLQGLTSIIRKKLDKETTGFDGSELLGMVDKSVQKLKNTISELTEIAKVQKDLEQQAEKVSFQDIADDVKEDINGMIEESGVLLEEEWLIPVITYPRNNLRSILYNLLSNAVKYRCPDRQPKISTKTYQENGYVILQVEDNGLGISKQQQPKMFSMFKRFHSHVEGTGVGLYIIKRIVENRGGKIEVESEQNSGSVFKVYLKKDSADS